MSELRAKNKQRAAEIVVMLVLFVLLLLATSAMFWWRDTHPTLERLEGRQIAQEQQLARQSLEAELCAELVQVRQEPAALAALSAAQWDRLVNCELRLQANTGPSTTERGR